MLSARGLVVECAERHQRRDVVGEVDIRAAGDAGQGEDRRGARERAEEIHHDPRAPANSAVSGP